MKCFELISHTTHVSCLMCYVTYVRFTQDLFSNMPRPPGGCTGGDDRVDSYSLWIRDLPKTVLGSRDVVVEAAHRHAHTHIML